MKNALSLMLVVTLVAGCAKKEEMAAEQSVAPASLEVAAPAEEAPAAPAPEAAPAADEAGRANEALMDSIGDTKAEGTQTCSSGECTEWCKNAGALAPACAEAFAKGCSADKQPAGVDCDWEAKPRAESKADDSKEAESEPAGTARPKRRPVPVEEPGKVRTVTNAD